MDGEAVLTSTHNLCFEQKYEKYQNFYLKKVFSGEIINIFEQACFRNACLRTCTHNEDSNPHSLIRVLVVRMKNFDPWLSKMCPVVTRWVVCSILFSGWHVYLRSQVLPGFVNSYNSLFKCIN